MTAVEAAPLICGYRGVVCDLDGVVYRGEHAVPHAIESLAGIRAAGLRIVYATNNASRPPAHVADHLERLGVQLDAADVVTSSQAGARRLAGELPAGATVLAVGGEGVPLALDEAGLLPIRAERVLDHLDRGGTIAAVLQGFGPDVSWRDLAEAALAVSAGARWVATNTDITLPIDRGIVPGNGTLVGAVRDALGVAPIVVGKPHPPLYEAGAAVLGTSPAQTLAIGDRLDTDIEGAVNAGMDSLYVMTGVSRVREVALADASRRPTFLAVDLRATCAPYLTPVVRQEGALIRGGCGAALAVAGPQGLDLHEGGDGNERLRALVAAVWALRDAAAGADPIAAWDDDEWDRAQGWVDAAGRGGAQTP